MKIKILQLGMLLFNIGFSIVAHCKSNFVFYTELFPPFILENNDTISGPFIQSFKELISDTKLSYSIKELPFERAIIQMEKEKNTCVLNADNSSRIFEISIPVARLSKSIVWVYSTKSDAEQKINSISDLNEFSIAVDNIPDIKTKLSNSNLNFEVLSRNADVFRMLHKKRFDILITDIDYSILPKNSTYNIYKKFSLLTYEKWLICNQNSDISEIKKIRDALKVGLFSDRVKKIWLDNNLQEYYLTNKNTLSN